MKKNEWLKMKKSSFVEGTIIATLAIVIVKILGMLYVIPFYAMVSIQGSALYAYAYNIYVIFLDISTAGLPIAISKLINEYDTLGMMEAKKRAYRIGKGIVLFASVTIFLVLFIFAPQIGQMLLGDLSGGNTTHDLAMAIRCVSLAILVVPFLSVSKGYLQGHKIINVSSISQIIEQVVRIAVILVGVYVALNVFDVSETVAICVAVSGAFFGALIAYLYVSRKIYQNKKQLGDDECKVKDNVENKEIVRKVISYAIPFIVINTIFSIYNFVDMVLVLRTMNFLGMSTNDVEFITSSIATWAPKINMIISSVAMGMTVSLIPTIVSAYTLRNVDEVNRKLNQALQMIIMISLPMAIGLSLLSKPVWSVFYGLENDFGPMILSLSVFVSFVGNIYMITSSTLQSLNKFKLVYSSALIGFVLNAMLDVPIMLLYYMLGIPPFLGASTASIIGYTVGTIYALYKLKKEHWLYYDDVWRVLLKLIVPSGLLVLVVVVFKSVIPVDYSNKLECILFIALNAGVGALVYLGVLYRNGTLKEVLGKRLFDKILKKLTLGKLGN